MTGSLPPPAPAATPMPSPPTAPPSTRPAARQPVGCAALLVAIVAAAIGWLTGR